jgi:hypothetical protein
MADRRSPIADQRLSIEKRAVPVFRGARFVFQLVTVPCSTQRADQPVGTICTTIRRRQCPQYRGGSSSARAAHRSWPSAAVGSPHCPQ